MFNAAEVTSLVKGDMVEYRKSKRYYEDTALYREAALEEGAKKGCLEGRLEERKENARKLFYDGADLVIIHQILGISPHEC